MKVGLHAVRHFKCIPVHCEPISFRSLCIHMTQWHIAVGRFGLRRGCSENQVMKHFIGMEKHDEIKPPTSFLVVITF